MIFGLPVISVAIWLPIVFGILVLATGGDRNAPLARILALVGSVLGFLVTIPLYTGFVRDTSEMQFVELHDWIARFNIHYHLAWMAFPCCSSCSPRFSLPSWCWPAGG